MQPTGQHSRDTWGVGVAAVTPTDQGRAADGGAAQGTTADRLAALRGAGVAHGGRGAGLVWGVPPRQPLLPGPCVPAARPLFVLLMLFSLSCPHFGCPAQQGSPTRSVASGVGGLSPTVGWACAGPGTGLYWCLGVTNCPEDSASWCTRPPGVPGG